MSKKHTERLDVEDDDAREARLKHLLQRTNSTASPAANNRPGPSPFDFGVRETHPMDPPTHLLDRLQQFLPQLEAANAELETRMQDHPESVDIENLDDTDNEQYIEMTPLRESDLSSHMIVPLDFYSCLSSSQPRSLRPNASPMQNLGLGVFDMHRAATGNTETSSSSSSSSSDSSDDDASTSEEDSSDTDTVIRGDHISDINSISAQRPIKALPKRSRPNIIVLGETNTAQSPPENAAD